MNVQIVRGDEFIDDRLIHKRIDGVPLNFTRRRYGTTMYTWVEAWFEGKGWVLLGDPWACVTPKKSEIERAIRYQRGA